MYFLIIDMCLTQVRWDNRFNDMDENALHRRYDFDLLSRAFIVWLYCIIFYQISLISKTQTWFLGYLLFTRSGSNYCALGESTNFLHPFIGYWLLKSGLFSSNDVFLVKRSILQKGFYLDNSKLCKSTPKNQKTWFFCLLPSNSQNS